MALLSAQEFEATIQTALQRLKSALNPIAIYLFGSYAYGKPSFDSDLDLLVIVESSDLGAY